MAFTDKRTRRRLQSIDLLKLALVVITFSGVYLFVTVHDIEKPFITADLSLTRNFEPKLQWNDSYFEGMDKTLDSLDHLERDDAFQDLFNFDSDYVEQIKPSSKPTLQRKSNFRKRRSVVRSVRDSKTKIQFDERRNLDSRNGSVYQLDSQRQSAPIDSRNVSVNLRKSSDSERKPKTMKSINDHPPTSLGKELQSSELHSPNLQMESEETEQQLLLPVDHQGQLPPKITDNKQHSDPLPKTSSEKVSSNSDHDSSKTVSNHQSKTPPKITDNKQHSDSPPKTSPEKARSNSEQDSRKTASNHQSKTPPKITDDKQHSDPLPKTSSEKRKSLLIFGDDRSGTTFLTKMFAADPQMFTVYEPLWVTKRWFSQINIRNAKKIQFTRDVVNALLSCQFTRSRAGKQFLSETSSSWVGNGVFEKNAFRTDAFKKKTKSGETTWLDLYENPEFAEEVCLNKFKHSVVKVGQVRVPQASIGVFIPHVLVANPDTDIRIIHIVRDPRGSINSRIKAGWISDFTFTGFPAQVENVCGKITKNIEFGRNIETAWIKERYLEINYKEITRMPITTAKKIYKFAGFEMPDSLIDWIVQSTNPDEKELKEALNNPFSHVRDARKNYLKWRSESPIKRVRLIEKVCKDLLDLLGLEAVADEMEVLCP